MQQLLFYTKLNCHLCEEAYRVVLDVVPDIRLDIEVIDISLPHQAEAMARYGERIPVIAKPGSGAELAWPFTTADVRQFLTAG